MRRILEELVKNAVALYGPSLPFALFLLVSVDKFRPRAGGILISAPVIAPLIVLGEWLRPPFAALTVGASIVVALLGGATTIAFVRPSSAQRTRAFLLLYSVCNLVGSILLFAWLNERGKQH